MSELTERTTTQKESLGVHVIVCQLQQLSVTAEYIKTVSGTQVELFFIIYIPLAVNL
jgi:hypothetical protein